jgi:hypothetical protein
MSRRSKIDDDALVGRILDALRAGCTYEASASAGPISPSTFYEWMRHGETDPESAYGEFAERVRDAELEAERRITEQWTAAVPSDWRAAVAFLERRFPERWRKPEHRHHTYTPVGGYVPSDVVLTDSERARQLVESIDAWLAQRDEVRTAVTNGG